MTPCEEYAHGGFAYSVADNSLIWDPVRGFWTTPFNANGFIITVRTEKWYFPPVLFLLRDSPETIPCSIEPNIPIEPDCSSAPGQISNDISRIDASWPFRRIHNLPLGP